MDRTLVLFLAGSFCLFFAGCAGKTLSHAPSTAPSIFPPVAAEPAGPAEGSLFSADQETNLFVDFRARRIGDVVTILISENLKGAKTVKTQTERKSDMNVGLSGILGLEWEKRLSPRYTNSPPGATVDATQAIGGSTSDKFDGSGKTSRDASLTGTVSARVLHVLPGGNLFIEGSRELRINNETQYLILSGVIRPKDLSPDNTISSTRIADARIEYTGGGVLSEKQSPAWFARILGLLALF